jgi:hypothetical protein
MNATERCTPVRVDSFSAESRNQGLRARLGRNLRRLAPVAGVVAASLSNAACSASVAPSQLPSASVGAPVCHATGPARTVARRVFVPRGVAASVEDGAFAVRFASAASRCLEVEWPLDADGARPAACPAPGDRTATSEYGANEATLAWDSRDGQDPPGLLGAVTDDAPRTFFGNGIGIDLARHVVDRTFAYGARQEPGEMAPALAPIGHDRFLLAWVDGDVETHELRAQSVVGWGEPLGPAMVLSPDSVSVIGRPSVVVAPSGYGLVTYLASTDGEFDVLATPIACAMN